MLSAKLVVKLSVTNDKCNGKLHLHRPLFPSPWKIVAQQTIAINCHFEGCQGNTKATVKVDDVVLGSR